MGSRLVANRVTPGHAPSNAATIAADASARCSQLSRRISISRSAMNRMSKSSGGATRLIGQPECSRDGQRDKIGMGERSQVDVPHAVGEVVEHLACDLDGETRLTRPAIASQCDDAVLLEKLAHFRHLRIAADETRELCGQSLRCSRFGHSQRRKLVAEVGMAQLQPPAPDALHRVTQCVPRSVSHVPPGS